jgi:transcriptional regulator with XRE-family HTH domain
MSTTFGENLRSLLKSLAISQKWVAENLEVDKNTMSWWVNGKSVPSRNRREKICALFNELRPSLQLDPDRITILPVDVDLPELGAGRIAGVEGIREIGINYADGLLELLSDIKLRDLLRITPEEIGFLKSLAYPVGFRPSKQTYLDLLHDFRLLKEKEIINTE